MDKKTQLRVQKLEFLLTQTDKIHLRNAAELLNVSEMTIRRDVNTEHSNMSLIGGYILKNNQDQPQLNHLLSQRQTKNVLEKIHIGKIAANLVEEGDTIFFDGGSTIPFIASQIPNTVRFTAICCSINTFLILREKPNCKIYLCGGSYSQDDLFINPVQNPNLLDLICTTKAFISASGVDKHLGLTCFRLDEAQIKHKAMAKTAQKILIFDHSKFNQVQQAYFGKLEEFDTIICNQSLPDDFSVSSQLNIMV
ncbi:DNA-binding transcriptional repressor DeoR [Necropsobacter massiliensis]|uniref:DNA-binding transcriptional repressor DeoR n=1 Tax=Necropsobacter massiliensis TaxID=1400001 RepID=UPI000595883A|nr:DNA-binding transcriptional repressor DeoR [Necropsobacter massiliensis]